MCWLWWFSGWPFSGSRNCRSGRCPRPRAARRAAISRCNQPQVRFRWPIIAARLKEYVEFFDPGIVGVTGTPQALSEIAARYGVFYAEQKVATAGDGYVVDHTSDTYVIDAAGKLAGKIAHATPPDQVVVALRQYLKQP